MKPARARRRRPRTPELRHSYDLYTEIQKMLREDAHLPQTLGSLYWLGKLEEALDNAAAYWANVRDRMDEAAFELERIEKGQGGEVKR
jgi:hypothetical protein